MSRKSVRGIITKDSEVVLMHRVKNGNEYWVVPGGGIEDGEAIEETLHRELEEEVGVKVTIVKEVARIRKKLENGFTNDVFFHCEYQSGEVGEGDGEEIQEMQSNNTYNIELVDVSKINEIRLLPQEIKEVIRSILQGVPLEEVLVIDEAV